MLSYKFHSTIKWKPNNVLNHEVVKTTIYDANKIKETKIVS